MTVTLEQYERAELEISMREARIGLTVHAIVTALVWAALIPVNFVVAPDFPWSAFVVAGMAIGLFFHWFGYRRAETDLRTRQARVEARARETVHA
jgi:uncharacterized membrane protein